MTAEQRSDEALAALACAGDDSAMAELIGRIMPYAHAKAAAFRSPTLTQEDLLQESMFGFLNAVSSFSLQRGESFRSYAAVCMRNRIISYIRAQTGGKHRPLNTALELDETVLPTQNDPQDILTEQEDANCLELFMADALSDLEQQVLALFLEQRSYDEIASRLCIGTKAVENALGRVRSKLRRKP